jgi:hypothetical protein
MTFIFAVTAGIGFASSNIANVTLARASRVTPAVTAAQTALADAMTARDRECKSGVGRFCREREATVIERRQGLDRVMHQVEQIADPQTEAAIRIVAWISHGLLRPTGDDFAMLRLILLALLPQIGGILLMVARWAVRDALIEACAHHDLNHHSVPTRSSARLHRQAGGADGLHECGRCSALSRGTGHAHRSKPRL